MFRLPFVVLFLGCAACIGTLTSPPINTSSISNDLAGYFPYVTWTNELEPDYNEIAFYAIADSKDDSQTVCESRSENEVLAKVWDIHPGQTQTTKLQLSGFYFGSILACFRWVIDGVVVAVADRIFSVAYLDPTLVGESASVDVTALLFEKTNDDDENELLEVQLKYGQEGRLYEKLMTGTINIDTDANPSLWKELTELSLCYADGAQEAPVGMDHCFAIERPQQGPVAFGELDLGEIFIKGKFPVFSLKDSPLVGVTIYGTFGHKLTRVIAFVGSVYFL